MGSLDLLWWPAEPPPVPTEDEIFTAWLGFDGDCTLDEFREAYLTVRARRWC